MHKKEFLDILSTGHALSAWWAAPSKPSSLLAPFTFLRPMISGMTLLPGSRIVPTTSQSRTNGLESVLLDQGQPQAVRLEIRLTRPGIGFGKGPPPESGGNERASSNVSSCSCSTREDQCLARTSGIMAWREFSAGVVRGSPV